MNQVQTDQEGALGRVIELRRITTTTTTTREERLVLREDDDCDEQEANPPRVAGPIAVRSDEAITVPRKAAGEGR